MDRILRQLQGFTLFDMLDEGHLRYLASKSRIRVLEEGETLFSPHDQCSVLILMLSGQVRVEKLLPDGSEFIIESFSPPAVLSEACALLNRPFPVWIVASKSSSVLLIEASAISELFSEREFSLAFLRMLSEKLFLLQRKLELFSLHTAKQQIVMYLSDHQDAERPGLLDLGMSKSALGRQLGHSRETISRILSSLIRDGILAEESSSSYLLLDAQRFSDILLDS